MTTKLTLSVDQKLIDEAKVYAKNHGTSISKMVEGYLKEILKSNNADSQSKASIIDSLSGIIKVDDDFDFDKVRLEILKEKYGL